MNKDHLVFSQTFSVTAYENSCSEGETEMYLEDGSFICAPLLFDVMQTCSNPELPF
jgi:hypothetical protein